MAKKVEYDRDLQRQYDHGNYWNDPHTASILITCPFCQTDVRAYVWSLAGSGKKCPGCGAIHTSFGFTLPIKK